MFLPLYMAMVSEGHISSGSKLDWNLCVRLRDQTARVICEGLNVSVRSSCLSFNSCLALTMPLNHTRPFQLLSALPKKDRLQRPPAHALPGLVYPSALSITPVVFLGIRLLFLLRLLRINFV